MTSVENSSARVRLHEIERSHGIVQDRVGSRWIARSRWIALDRATIHREYYSSEDVQYYRGGAVEVLGLYPAALCAAHLEVCDSVQRCSPYGLDVR